MPAFEKADEGDELEGQFRARMAAAARGDHEKVVQGAAVGSVEVENAETAVVEVVDAGAKAEARLPGDIGDEPAVPGSGCLFDSACDRPAPPQRVFDRCGSMPLALPRVPSMNVNEHDEAIKRYSDVFILYI
jgi:hypothetical protein